MVRSKLLEFKILRYLCTMKPPNILIRSTCMEKFNKQRDLMKPLLKPDNYTIYHLNDDKFYKQPWHDACALLLFEYNEEVLSNEEEIQMLCKYVNKEGNILLHGDGKGCDISHVMDKLNLCGEESHQNSTNFVCITVHAMLLKKNLLDVPHEELRCSISSLGLDVAGTRQDDTAHALPAYFYTTDSNMSINSVFNFDISNPNHISGDRLKINIYEEYSQQTRDEEEVSEDFVLNIDCRCPQSSTFNWLLYEKKLNTKLYGRQVLFKNVIPSTQDVFTRLRHGTIKADGFLVTATQQSKGHGRGGNEWLSPLGCMMFSLCIGIQMQSALGQRLSFIQHMAVVAFVKSIKERDGYENLELSIKWPNDIYIKRSIKIGGVIVNCSTLGRSFNAVIGLGVNISNSEPTSCLNSLIREYNEIHGSLLKEFSIEEVLAGTINNFERLVELFQKHGVERFKKEYYKHWMHDDAKVTLEAENNAEAVVTGLDEFGYLEVKLANGKKLCLQPDGNTFDLMRNMIRLKP